jgi:inosine-uridine nucleoside N-ribohydrolase
LSDLPLEHPKVLANDWNAYENEHAALALIRIFENNPDTTLACIGPLTNIALALKLDPRFRKWAKKIVIMGGNIHGRLNSFYYQNYSIKQWETSHHTRPQNSTLVMTPKLHISY